MISQEMDRAGNADGGQKVGSIPKCTSVYVASKRHVTAVGDTIHGHAVVPNEDVLSHWTTLWLDVKPCNCCLIVMEVSTAR